MLSAEDDELAKREGLAGRMRDGCKDTANRESVLNVIPSLHTVTERWLSVWAEASLPWQTPRMKIGKSKSS